MKSVTVSFLIACLTAAMPMPSLADDLFIVDATVVSADRDTPLEDMDILIRNGRIADIAEHIAAPDGVEVLDADGRYVIPGLIDSHVHLYHATGLKRRYTERFDDLYSAYMIQMPKSYLYYGYTTLIELNADFETNDQVESSPLHPHLLHCGRGLVLPDGFMALDYPEGRIADEFPNFLYDHYRGGPLPDGAHTQDHSPDAVVEATAANGGICVKLYYEEALWSPGGPPQFALPTKEIVRDVVRAAHDRNMTVMLHATAPRGHDFAMATGVDIVVHGLWEWPGVAFDEQAMPDSIADLVDREAASGMALQPTMRTLRNTASMFDPGLLEDPNLAHVLPGGYINYLRTEAQQQRDLFLGIFGSLIREDAGTDDMSELQGAFNSRYEALIGRMHKAGATLLLGSDTVVGGLGWGNPPGLNGYWEMQGWERAGIPLRDIFEAATLGNASAFGLDDVGTVAEGKQADLLILGENPLETLAAYDSIETVILGGKPIPRERLSALQSDRW